MSINAYASSAPHGALSGDQLRNLIEYAPMQLALFDREVRYIAASKRWIAEQEGGRTDLAGLEYYALHPEAPPYWRQVHQDVLAGAVRQNDAEHYVRADGREYWSRWVCFPWLGANAEIGGFAVAVEDTTEHHLATRRLEASERQLRTILDALPVMVASVDAAGRYAYVSRRYEEYFGIPAERITGMTVADLIGEEAFRRARPYLQRTLRGERVSFENPVKLADGEQHLLRIDFVPDFDERGQVQGCFCVAIDITERLRTDVEVHHLRSQIDLLARRQVAHQTIAAVAHDLNQPLNAAGTFSEAAKHMILKGYPDDEVIRTVGKAAAEIQRAGDVLRKLIDSTQAASKTSARTLVDLNDASRRAQELFQMEKLLPEPEMRVDLAPGAIMVDVDAVAIEKVMINLLRNAGEAIASQGIAGTGSWIRLATGIADGQAVFCVEDSGPGVAPDVMLSLFEPFSTSKPWGIGMGLAISRRLIELHGGRIWHEAREKGAAFCFSLPLAK